MNLLDDHLPTNAAILLFGKHPQRDYNSNGSVQVMLFSDRLEVWNPGTLPPSLSLEDLRHPHGSIPGNPLLAEALYLAKYIERMGTGTRDMIAKCRASKLPEPEFALADGFVTTIRRPLGTEELPVTPPVSEFVEKLVLLLDSRGPLSNAEILASFDLRDRRRLRETYIDPALAEGLVKRTIPEKPTSRLQKYRLTDKGHAVLLQIKKKGGPS